MEKWICAAVFAVSALFIQPVFAAATNEPCVMLKFNDETRFYKIGAADMLSDLVMEKLLASGKFSLKETRPLDPVAEQKLYDGNATANQHMNEAAKSGKYDDVFDGEGFSDKKALDITQAKKWQTVSPELMASIGQNHKAAYIIQGSIVNMGKGLRLKDDIGRTASIVGGIANLAGFGKLGGAVSDTLGGTITEENTLGVLVTLRVIEAQSGLVVWNKEVLGKSTIKQHRNKRNDVTVGTDKMTNEIFAKAVDNAADEVVKALIADAEAGKLFVK